MFCRTLSQLAAPDLAGIDLGCEGVEATAVVPVCVVATEEGAGSRAFFFGAMMMNGGLFSRIGGE